MIYSFLNNAIPFGNVLSEDGLAAQMINFVEPLPAIWHPKWARLRVSAKRPIDLPSEIRPPSKSKLQQMFDEKVSDPSLEPLFPVIQGLVRFLPSHRISASQALDMLEGQNRKG